MRWGPVIYAAVAAPALAAIYQGTFQGTFDVAQAQEARGFAPCAAITVPSIGAAGSQTVQLSNCGANVLLYNISANELFYNIASSAGVTVGTANYSLPGNQSIILTVPVLPGNNPAPYLAAFSTLGTTLRINQGWNQQ